MARRGAESGRDRPHAQVGGVMVAGSSRDGMQPGDDRQDRQAGRPYRSPSRVVAARNGLISVATASGNSS